MKTQRNMSQIEEQDKTTERDLNKIDTICPIENLEILDLKKEWEH